jgi:ATP-dependent Clp protease ATP-binding subunit ClpA
MFELFTAEARDAILEAQIEVRELGHDHVGTEHLLLGLLRLPPGAASRPAACKPADIGPRVLADLGITLDRVRAEVQGAVRGYEPGLTEADTEALRSIGIDVNEIRKRVEETFGPGALDAPAAAGQLWSTGPPGKGPGFTPKAKQAMQVAVRESIRLGHRHIGTEHLLLAVTVSEGLSADILRRLGADPLAVRTRVLQQLGLAA